MISRLFKMAAARHLSLYVRIWTTHNEFVVIVIVVKKIG